MGHLREQGDGQMQCGSVELTDIYGKGKMEPSPQVSSYTKAHSFTRSS